MCISDHEVFLYQLTCKKIFAVACLPWDARTIKDVDFIVFNVWYEYSWSEVNYYKLTG